MLDFVSVSGSFDTIDLPALPSGSSFDASGLLSTGTFTAVPEPAAGAGLLAGTLLIVARPRRAGGISSGDAVLS